MGTPDPATDVFAVSVQTQLINLTNKPRLETTVGPLVPATLFKNLDARFGLSHLNSLGVSDWMFIGQSVGNPTTTFYFAADKTPAQMMTPFKRSVTFRKMDWDTILLGLKLIAVRSYPITGKATNDLGAVVATYVQRYVVRERFVPGNNLVTKFEKLEYTSPRPFKFSASINTPVPGALTFQLPTGERFGFPSCLHTRQTLAKLLAGIAISSATDVVTPNFEEIEGQDFPATTPTTWLPYATEQDQSDTNGFYYGIRLIVHPPPIPRPKRNVSSV